MCIRDSSTKECVDHETALQFQFSGNRRNFFWIGLGLLLGVSIISLVMLICHRSSCWFKKNYKAYDHFPMEILEMSDEDLNDSSMKYPFENEKIRDTVSDGTFGFNTNSNRGSDYNYWDIPEQKINQFHYSFNRD